MKSKFWGHRVAERGGTRQFVMLANANGSSSCRLFDALSGSPILYTTSRGGTYEANYGDIFRECQELVAPPGVKTSEIAAGLPRDHLVSLQGQVGIQAPAGLAQIPAPNGRGMLTGTRELIQAVLGLSVGYETRTAAMQLSRSPVSLNAGVLLDRWYERILENWDRSECRSSQLWRSFAKTEIAAHNTSPEKTLEKAIVEWAPGWFNQIPAAAGLLSGVEEKHRNVDLGHFEGTGHLQLVELKAGPHADTPLMAAFEIAGYGLLYCFARAHRNLLALARENRVLDARRVDLRVLAPREVFAGYQFKWLEASLETGFQQFSERHFTGSLEMSFRFECFPAHFQWPGTPAYQLPKVLEGRVPVLW